MKILHVASEVAPWCQSGGLADVVGALPGAVDQLGGGAVRSAVVAPLYRGARERALALGAEVSDAGDATVVLGATRVQARWVSVKATERPTAFLLDAPALYDRDGFYVDGDGVDFDDNALRFAVLSRAACEHGARLLGATPDIVHAHDWQTGLAPVYASAGAGTPPKTVFTIHNLAHQGNFAKDLVPQLGLDWSLFNSDQLEFYDQLSFLKAGVALSDAVTTVSPSYAEEITTSDLGFGLTGFLDGRLRGIVNGIDVTAWDPSADTHIAERYSAANPAGKGACRQALVRALELDAGPDTLLIGIVSRLAWQKGIDLVANLAPALEGMGAALVVLGDGDAALGRRLCAAAAACPARIAVRMGFDVPLSHQIYAGCDAILVPSRFEPCGLTQLYAMRFGAVPIVRATGGLKDTVEDPGDAALRLGDGNGIAFSDATVEDLSAAVLRAVALHRDQSAWARVVQAGMQRDSSWSLSARRYLDTYRSLVA